jgi:hypothetical protein
MDASEDMVELMLICTSVEGVCGCGAITERHGGSSGCRLTFTAQVNQLSSSECGDSYVLGTLLIIEARSQLATRE